MTRKLSVSRYSIRHNTTKKILSSFFFNFSAVIKGLNVTVDLKLGVNNNKVNISNLVFHVHLKECNVSIVSSFFVICAGKRIETTTRNFTIFSVRNHRIIQRRGGVQAFEQSYYRGATRIARRLSN